MSTASDSFSVISWDDNQPHHGKMMTIRENVQLSLKHLRVSLGGKRCSHTWNLRAFSLICSLIVNMNVLGCVNLALGSLSANNTHPGTSACTHFQPQPLNHVFTFKQAFEVERTTRPKCPHFLNMSLLCWKMGVFVLNMQQVQ